MQPGRPRERVRGRAPDLIQPFRRALRALVRPGDCLVVGASGGPDSTALLDLAARVAPGARLRLLVAHVDHGWRPDSAEDAERVGAAAADRGLPFVATALRDPPPSEGAAREARLRFFAETAADAGAAGVLLGHTAEDQAETVLLHLLRGSGVAGLSGMRPATVLEVGQRPVRLLRPLLGIGRASVRDYCRARGLPTRDDPSNQDLAYLRNRVRHQLLPLLVDMQPRALEAIARLAELAADDVEIVAGAVEQAWPAVAASADDGWSIDRTAFRALAPALQRALLRRMARQVLGPANDVTLERVEAARRLLQAGGDGAVLEWPGPLRVTLAGRRATFVRGTS